MIDLLLHPRWQQSELGKPIPDTIHAVSVCLPTWADNIGYEEQEPRVIDRLSTGYPRFVHHPYTRQLFSECVRRFARPGETCIAYPSRLTAENCQLFLHEQGIRSALHAYGANGIFAVTFPVETFRTAKCFWQHSGVIVSSRLAEATLSGSPGRDGGEAKAAIRQRLAGLVGAEADDVYLFGSGMAAIYEVYRQLQLLLPDRRCVQFGFPYTDTIKIQEKFGRGVHFLARADDADYVSLEELVAGEPIMGLFCEFPSNPLLISPDLPRLAGLARRRDFPVIVDDTIGSFHNVNVLPHADVLVSSLTKQFSGVGDVMGGVAVLNRESPWYERLKQLFGEEYEELVWGEDAIVLEQNSRDYTARAARAGATAEILCDALVDHPAVERLWYPKYQTSAHYRTCRRPGGTWSTLFSLLLKGAPTATPAFFDALRVSKGPNLGTNYTLCCPYAILAHYQELDFVETCGVSRYLIRVSVGLEEPADLTGRFLEALSAR